MKRFLKAFQLLQQVADNVEDNFYTKRETLEDDLLFAFGVMKQNMPEFPFFMSRQKKRDIVKEVIDETQLEIAHDWLDMEPELKYKNEWDQSEAIEGFEEYLIQQTARKAANRAADTLKDALAKDYRKSLRKYTRRSDILNLYDKLKHEQSKEAIVLPSAKKEDE